MTATIISTFAGVLAGGFITYLVSSHYYEHASEDLRHESESLRNLVSMLAHHLEANGMLEGVQWDKEGNLKYFLPQTISPTGAPNVGRAGTPALRARQEPRESPESEANPGPMRTLPTPASARRRAESAPGGVGCSGAGREANVAIELNDNQRRRAERLAREKGEKCPRCGSSDLRCGVANVVPGG